jgi:MtN3 and saliva related transmembrane protein
MLSIIGFFAFFTSTISLLPQLYQTYKTKSAQDVSLLMLINFVAGSGCWIAYGFLTDTVSVWLTNIFGGITSVWMLLYKLKYGVMSK